MMFQFTTDLGQNGKLSQIVITQKLLPQPLKSTILKWWMQLLHPAHSAQVVSTMIFLHGKALHLSWYRGFREKIYILYYGQWLADNELILCQFFETLTLIYNWLYVHKSWLENNINHLNWLCFRDATYVYYHAFIASHILQRCNKKRVVAHRVWSTWPNFHLVQIYFVAQMKSNIKKNTAWNWATGTIQVRATVCSGHVTSEVFSTHGYWLENNISHLNCVFSKI
jgi:hypothetical protein